MNTIKALLATSILLSSSVANAVLVTDPNDARSWQGATVGTFAQLLYGADTLANRQLVVTNQLLDDGLWIDPVGFGLGNYVKGANGMGGSPDPTTLAFNGATVDGTFAGNADARDFFWVQDNGNTTTFSAGITGGRPSEGIVWDLGGQANQAVVFVQVDHGPLPGEVLENTAWLSNDPNAVDAGWVQAELDRVFLEGWSPGPNIVDGFAVTYRLPGAQTFRYVSVTHGGPGAVRRDGDNEIDAVGGLTAQGGGLVPEPSIIALMGIGLLGLGFARRSMG